MNTFSRRSFLKTSSLFAAALPLVSLGSSQGSSPKVAGAGDKSRGLFFDKSDLPRMRAALKEDRFSALRATLFETDLDADLKFLRDELRLNNKVQDMLRARQILERTAFAFALSGDPAQANVAKVAIGRILEYKTWDYFIEGGRHTFGLQRAPEATIAMCCALDWLGDALEPELVAEMEKQIAEKGAAACYVTLYGMKYPDRVQGWEIDRAEESIFRVDLSRWPLILNSTNLKVIPTCALGVAALWLHGRHPEAGKWLEMSRHSARAFGTMYGLDGSYDEGVGYWGYTTMHMIMLADVLQRRLGIDDRNLLNYPGTVRYALAMAMPTAGAAYNNPNEKKEYNATPKGSIDPAGDMVNFGDSGMNIDVSVAPWVAREFNDPLAVHVARNTGGFRHLHALFWYDPDARGVPPGPELHDVKLSNDWIVSRTGWEVADSVVALRSGGPANHEHADRNSVIFKAYGERLFHDPFKAGYAYTSPRWLLRLTEAHTAVLIGGQGHQYHDGSEGTNASWASARVTQYSADAAGMLAVSDATEAYQLVIAGVEFVERIVFFSKPDLLVLIDRVRLSGDPRPVQARFQVLNEDGKGGCSASASGFSVTRPHATLESRVSAAAGFSVNSRQHELPAEEGVYPFVEVESPVALEHTIVTASSAAPLGASHGALEVTSDGDVVSVKGTHLGRAISVRLRLKQTGAELLV